MDRLLAASALSAVAGLVLLGVLAHTTEPPLVPLPRLPHYEGQRVCVEAHLAHHRAPTPETTRFVLAEDDQSLAGRAPFAWSLRPGERVRACGALLRTAAGLELRLARPADVEALTPRPSDDVDLGELLKRPWDHLDGPVWTRGVVEREGLRSVLHAPASQEKLPLADPPSPGAWRIHGQLEYDPERAAFRFHVLGTAPP